MSKRDFTYCNGKRCALKEHCVRYIEGQNVPKDVEGFWWTDHCDEHTRDMYINRD